MSVKLNNIHLYKYVPDSEIPSRKVNLSKQEKLLKKKAFIKGPLDLSWISRASHLPGKTLNVALALMYISGLNKSKESLKLNRTIYKLFNVSRATVYSALNKMEKEGLIRVIKSSGRKNVITIIENTEDEAKNKVNI